jgi:hypothetical protein
MKPVKVLQAPAGRHDSSIVAIAGSLRVIDPPKPCRGFATGCICKACLVREDEVRLARSVSTLPVVEQPRQPWQPRRARAA